jgi:hypothetical protein
MLAAACVTVPPTTPAPTESPLATAVAVATATVAPVSAAPSAAGSTTPAPTATAAPTPTATPTVPIALIDGVATVSVTGDVLENFQVSTDEVGTFTPGASTGAVEAEWENEDLSRLLRLTLDVSSPGEVPQGSAFIAIGLGGSDIDDGTTYFPDALRSQCQVTVTRLDVGGIAGSFACTELTSVDGSRTIDAQGDFDAVAAIPGASPTALEPPTGALAFTSGTAQAATGGGVATTFDAILTSGTWSPDTGQLELYYADDAGDTALVRLQVESSVTDTFVAIGAPGSTIDDANYFFDGTHTQCTATISRFDQTGIDGGFSCLDLPNGAGDLTIDASGTFSAAP